MGHTWTREDVHAGFGGKRRHLEELGIGGNVVLKYLKGIYWGRVDWIGLTWNRNKCWAVMYAGINFVVYRTQDTCLPGEELCISRRTQLHGVS
jgi:hypothetical protein